MKANVATPTEAAISSSLIARWLGLTHFHNQQTKAHDAHRDKLDSEGNSPNVDSRFDMKSNTHYMRLTLLIVKR